MEESTKSIGSGTVPEASLQTITVHLSCIHTTDSFTIVLAQELLVGRHMLSASSGCVSGGCTPPILGEELESQVNSTDLLVRSLLHLRPDTASKSK